MTDNIDTLLNGGMFDPKECISSEGLTNKLTETLDCSQCRECKAKVFHKMDCSSKELPLLRSERYQLNQRIRALQEQLNLSQTVTLHGVTRIINENAELTKEQKETLLDLIWK